MRIKTIGKVFAIILVFSLFLASCDLFAADEEADEIAQTYVAQTQQAEGAAQTAVAETLSAEENGEPETLEAQTPEDNDVASPEPIAKPSLTHTITLTLTPQAPQVHVDRDTNCRAGPGQPYNRLSGLLVDEEAEVVGRWQGGDYWIIKNPDGDDECWLWGRYATVEGPTGDLPAYTQPPTPTPTFTPTSEVDWSGVWTIQEEDPSGGYFQGTMTVTQNNGSATGTFNYSAGSNGSLSGSLSADGRTWSGTWQNSFGSSGTFNLRLINQDQYIGNASSGSAYANCGYRQGSGAGYPSPCMWP